MLSDAIFLSATYTHLAVVYQVHTSCTIRIRHNTVKASFGTSLRSMGATMAIVNTGSGYSNISRLTLPLGWQHHVCPGYEMFTVGTANRNLLQISSVFILRIRFGCAVYKTDFSVAYFPSEEVLIGIWFMNRHVNSIRCINRQVKCTRKLLTGRYRSLEASDWNLWKKNTVNRPQTQLRRWSTIPTSYARRPPFLSRSPYPPIQ